MYPGDLNKINNNDKKDIFYRSFRPRQKTERLTIREKGVK